MITVLDIETRFKKEDSVAISGIPDVKKTGSIEFKNATIEKFSDLEELNETGSLIPIYPKIEGLSSTIIRKGIKEALKRTPKIEDFVSRKELGQYKIIDRISSYNKIHFPDTINEFEVARNRLAFDEFIYLQSIFKEIKETELNLGLDLQGGMHVTLEVSPIDIVKGLSGNNRDIDFNQALNNAKEKYIRDNQYLVIAPTLHCGFTRATENTIVGERSMGDARLNYEDQIYGWFDYLLKGKNNNFKKNTPRVQYYTMGSNKWQSSETWPPESATLTSYYLTSNGKANESLSNGKLSTSKANSDYADGFIYDPMKPVPSYGGNVCCTGNAVKGGAFDQQEMETRDDILVYTTDVLKEGIEVSGFIESTLYVSSDAKDTDFTIKIIDVYPAVSYTHLTLPTKRIV